MQNRRTRQNIGRQPRMFIVMHFYRWLTGASPTSRAAWPGWGSQSRTSTTSRPCSPGSPTQSTSWRTSLQVCLQTYWSLYRGIFVLYPKVRENISACVISWPTSNPRSRGADSPGRGSWQECWPRVWHCGADICQVMMMMMIIDIIGPLPLLAIISEGRTR